MRVTRALVQSGTSLISCSLISCTRRIGFLSRYCGIKTHNMSIRVESHQHASCSGRGAATVGPLRAQRARQHSRSRPAACCSVDPIKTSASSLSEAVSLDDGHGFRPIKPPVIQEELVKTRFIAETMLPTRQGKFRLRGYKHSVSTLSECFGLF